jgi:hypothetical protein
MIRCLSILLMIAATVFAASDTRKLPRSLNEIVEAEGVFAFSDGSSYYIFRKDGTFGMGPVGLSGRTISGTWRSLDSPVFEIAGTWSWVNGVSERNDRRRMKIYVAPVRDLQPSDISAGHHPQGVTKIYSVYFFVDELVKE